MAYRFDGSASFLAQTTTLPSNAWTMCAWVRPNDASATDLFLSAGNTTAIAVSAGFLAAAWSINDTGATIANFTTNPKAGEWWFLAMAHDGTILRGFSRRHDWRSFQYAQINRAALTLTSMRFGTSTFDGTDLANGRCAGARIWARVLSHAELMLESFQLAPRSRARLHTWGLEDSKVNLSGFSRNLTATGTVSREQGPLMVPLFVNHPAILDRVNTTSAASADISAAGAAVATLSTQSLASANLSSTAAASAVFASNATAPANLTSAGAASMILATNVLAKADLSSAGAASAVFTTQSSARANLSMAGSAVATLASAATASADLAMAGAGTGTLASAALASVALSMAGTATAIFEASAQAQGQADLSIAGSSSAVFGAQAVASADLAAAGASTAILESSSVGIASADFAAAGSASAVFGASSTGGVVVETPAPPSQALGGPGGGGRSKRRKRHDEELALIAEAMGEVFEKMVRGELIGQIEIDLRRTLH